MAIIRIQLFGGEAPSFSDRTLPNNYARVAQNLLAKTNEFRPLDADLLVATISNSNPNSLYRTPRAVGGAIDSDYSQRWVAPPSILTDGYYVPGQIDDDLTSRTYATGAATIVNGSTPFGFPLVFDSTGYTKRLGVPAPIKPVAVKTEVPEYSTEEDNAARKSVPDALYQALKDNTSAVPLGSYTPAGNPPTSTTMGWLRWDQTGVTDSLGGANGLPGKTVGEWNVLIPLQSGSGAYVIIPSFVGKYKFLMQTEFSGTHVIYLGMHYWAVPITMQGTGYSVNTTAMSTQVQAIQNPDTQVASWIPAAAANTFCTKTANYFATTELPQKTSILSQDRANVALVLALGMGQMPVMTATMTSFFNLTAVNAEINNAIAAFADDVMVKVDDAMVVDNGSLGRPTTAADIIALFPSNQTSSNTLLFSDSYGVRNISVNLIRNAVSGLLPDGFSMAPDLVSQRKYNAAKSLVITNAINANLVPIFSNAHWSSTYTAEFPLGSNQSTDSASSVAAADVSSAIAAVERASKQVTTDYDNVLIKINNTIKYDLFDAWIVVDKTINLPTPVTRAIDSRYYVTTLVTAWGEESSPSPVSYMLTTDQNDYVTITKPSGFPIDRQIAGWRLYRSNAGNQGAAFQLVSDKDATVENCGSQAVLINGAFDYFDIVTGTGYKDVIKSSSLQDTIATTTWLEPPSNLQGLTGMANGVMAGYYDNVICFCEPYVPYAWPVEYQQTTKMPITGLGGFGQSLFIGTRGNPYIANGSDSASISLIELPTSQACVSGRAVVSIPNGVLYASPDGICMADNGGVKVLSSDHFSRNIWQGMNPSKMFAAQHDGIYYFVFPGGTPGSGGIPASADPSGPGCYGFDYQAGKLVRVTFSTLPSAFFEDKISDTLYAAMGTGVYALFSAGTSRVGTYKTGTIRTPSYDSMAWIQVDSDLSGDVTVNWYADGSLKHSKVIHPSNGIAPLRLPSGIVKEHVVEVISSAGITSVTLASSTEELRSV
jgi:hypothetical protein